MARAPKATSFSIPSFDMRKMKLILIGDSPLVVHRFDEKAKKKMLDVQMKTASPGREAKDPLADFHASEHKLPDGRSGFPAVGFKACAVTIITSLKGTGVTKVGARQTFHVHGQRIEVPGSFSGSLRSDELVPIWSPPPRMREDMVRISMGTSDIRYRAEYWPWAVELDITFNASVMSAEQIVNLYNLAGFGVGVGEWRAEKNGSWGRFRVATEADSKLIDDLRQQSTRQTRTASTTRRKAAA